MRHPFVLVAFVVCEACGAEPRAGTRSEPAPSSSPPSSEPTATSSAPPSDPVPPAPAPCIPPPSGTAPTYTELYERYFAKGQPGHCATGHCHANPGFDVWLCGDTKDSCYAGMTHVGLINPDDPLGSLIGDRTESPLSWINPTGNMPFDATGTFPEGRDAILAWVAACAQND
ncbi:MAG TPA: hypothetical protein VHU80_03935 [Polyangiaceae bacterium]|jgi:hypothetical protein|nr:hypothetical protein [Polyangiaceae bacterium]